MRGDGVFLQRGQIVVAVVLDPRGHEEQRHADQRFQGRDCRDPDIVEREGFGEKGP